ncbi:checkpoint serine/threonine-protein kinase [Monoraphidium neglectum]|uniref:Checkpoint serine/threonine-protein kinase n=1 Tax=Monoraphidium neglectum TaxID=145388 RepID=A0A0D2JFQ9_9CHLO|nr:checkpoint serine/threonine-protein kinase [Monoraphidium neglectum]KIY98307.1 checkpoint serine/threonine-protein kinase [Monoraphidium neglectum]|eukprot:XP_013897327.1 checkpoint serine/threonine-protein kinase [Monoraphidium neglectum]
MELQEGWDTSKENFAPMRAGRQAHELQKTPLASSKTPDSELEEQRRYVKWTQESFPASGGKEQLLKALEAATKAMAGCERYYDDPRLLRLWIQYADCLPDPSDVFLFLQDRGIGRDLALLYEAYATFLELKGAFPRADLVYQSGIDRLAKPLERLKQKHAGFQQRMPVLG